MNDEMLSYDQAAEFLGLPKGTLYAMVSARRIPHVGPGPRLVRFRLGDLQAWVRSRVVAAQGEIGPVPVDGA